ncbi:type III effector HrpK domain-containing protein [Dickeya dianthicola]|uniref:type III effector HrpK domain-containing protein n=1 Tax=Dickeya dianthicola TaxID=204039 RepID=UPI00039B5DE9|nr:type III effector HrpK domain-containing protein [Dickeya dianthicola]ATO33223.1 hypothetical protein DDI_2055 [Dickeya dianthicola RNS04.9]MCA7003335.1 hypothetical protein [Dickeya dianthicola]MCI4001975.1 hypothetical protein [Dickeya dianthicola]MCI4032384.1 hypothetical protein [Dickeya dianthicola]MCI4068341.1 hypothetical protein [Dickeya dianthicola]
MITASAFGPALDTGKDGGKADGIISRRDIGAFIKNMTRSAQRAQRSLDDYRQAHPQADARSLRLVETSALLLANEPLLRAADPSHSAANAAPQRVSSLSRQTDLAALANGNPLLSPPACWSGTTASTVRGRKRSDPVVPGHRRLH